MFANVGQTTRPRLTAWQVPRWSTIGRPPGRPRGSRQLTGPWLPSLGGLIASCRTVVGWWVAGGELGGGVFGFPSLSFGDGAQEQHRARWYVGVCGAGSFPHVRPVVGTVGGLYAGLFQELPNECAAFGAVIIESFVAPFSGDEDAASGDA